jgi:hypothetical protein
MISLHEAVTEFGQMAKNICPLIYNIVFEHHVALIYNLFQYIFVYNATCCIVDGNILHEINGKTW